MKTLSFIIAPFHLILSIMFLGVDMYLPHFLNLLCSFVWFLNFINYGESEWIKNEIEILTNKIKNGKTI